MCKGVWDSKLEKKWRKPLKIRQRPTIVFSSLGLCRSNLNWNLSLPLTLGGRKAGCDIGKSLFSRRLVSSRHDENLKATPFGLATGVIHDCVSLGGVGGCFRWSECCNRASRLVPLFCWSEERGSGKPTREGVSQPICVVVWMKKGKKG